MLGPGNVVDQLCMQGPGAQSAPQRGCKRLLRRRPDDKQIWYLTITQPLRNRPCLTKHKSSSGRKERLRPVTNMALMKASSGRMDPATICSLMDLQTMTSKPTSRTE